jgi:hypothetical protein
MTAGPRPQRLGRASVTDRRELRISSDRCSNRMLKPGATCRLAVRFVPSQPGGPRATLTIADPGSSTPLSVSISASSPNFELDAEHPGPQGYGMSLQLFSRGNGGEPQALLIDFTKHQPGGESASDSYDLVLRKRFTLRLGADLGSGSAAAGFGSWGRMRLRATPQGGIRDRRQRLAPGCRPRSLTSMQRRVLIAGSLRLRTHTPLGAISVSHLTATMIRTSTFDSSCRNRSFYDLRLSGPAGASLTAFSESGAAQLVAQMPRQPAPKDPFILNELLLVHGGPTLFSADPDLSSATIASQGPLITGDATFQLTSYCAGDAAVGTLSGPITADFQLFGPVTFTSGTLSHDYGNCTTADDRR